LELRDLSTDVPRPTLFNYVKALLDSHPDPYHLLHCHIGFCRHRMVDSPATFNKCQRANPLASWRKQFKITEGKDRGRTVPLISQPSLVDDKRWQLVFGDYASIFLVKNPSGALIIERLDLFQSRNYIVYEPPLPVLPSDVNSVDSTGIQTGYKMYSRETGKLKRSGRVTHLVKRISRSRFDTPAGLIDGYYIDLDHRMEMEYKSQLLLSLGLGFRLEEGPVYGSGRYTVKKLGLFTETKTAAAALAKR
jgi:hypothetical protein